ncbi:hypothetical protein BDV95DRAFT_605924 [Massariosphaeria phaeospora]|uniref:Uncharacterized protein n=1 Tax=Massariosphaeria phaeospora TaxID=100035 RepID=A0A7C8M9B3_9PLEO|nr:hypothetical protein BDV95DRAFT_605924 [Massariosphaeria phaeospora]
MTPNNIEAKLHRLEALWGPDVNDSFQCMFGYAPQHSEGHHCKAILPHWKAESCRLWLKEWLNHTILRQNITDVDDVRLKSLAWWSICDGHSEPVKSKGITLLKSTYMRALQCDQNTWCSVFLDRKKSGNTKPEVKSCVSEPSTLDAAAALLQKQDYGEGDIELQAATEPKNETGSPRALSLQASKPHEALIAAQRRLEQLHLDRDPETLQDPKTSLSESECVKTLCQERDIESDQTRQKDDDVHLSPIRFSVCRKEQQSLSTKTCSQPRTPDSTFPTSLFKTTNAVWSNQNTFLCKEINRLARNGIDNAKLRATNTTLHAETEKLKISTITLHAENARLIKETMLLCAKQAEQQSLIERMARRTAELEAQAQQQTNEREDLEHRLCTAAAVLGGQSTSIPERVLERMQGSIAESTQIAVCVQ